MNKTNFRREQCDSKATVRLSFARNVLNANVSLSSSAPCADRWIAYEMWLSLMHTSHCVWTPWRQLFVLCARDKGDHSLSHCYIIYIYISYTYCSNDVAQNGINHEGEYSNRKKAQENVNNKCGKHSIYLSWNSNYKSFMMDELVILSGS